MGLLCVPCATFLAGLLCEFTQLPLPSALGWAGGGKQICRTVVLLFLMGLATMNTKYFGWKIFFSPFANCQVRLLLLGGPQGVRVAMFSNCEIFCHVLTDLGVLLLFVLFLCLGPWAQP